MIEKGDRVILSGEDIKEPVYVDGETQRTTLGVLDTERFIGMEYGEKTRLGEDEYWLLQFAVKDIPDIIKRQAQIVLPRIGAQIIMYCNISCGDKIVEGGAGSGALSALLTWAVGGEGSVTTYEKKEDFLKTAKGNMKKVGLTDSWDGVHGDITEDVDEEDVDAFIVDIPEPWEALNMVDSSLKPGGFFCAYVPTYNQLEKTVREMRERDYIGVRSFENVEREIEVNEGGVRPSFDMLGHTGFVATGRRSLE